MNQSISNCVDLIESSNQSTIIIKFMEENKKIARLNYQANCHHRQNLRKQIKPQLIDNLQISQHPSQNYKKAYQSIYHDEVQKCVEDQNLKKLKKRLEEVQAKRNFTQHQPSPDSRFQNTQQYPNNDRAPEYSPIKDSPYYEQLMEYKKKHNINFIDYAECKDQRIKALVDKNFDGGQSFYKNHDAYVKNKISKNISLQNILKDQIEWKSFARSIEQERKNMENDTFQQYTQAMRFYEMEKKNIKDQNMQNFRSELIKQMQDQRQRRNQKNKFQYQHISRHNPITNPIEYHIDNPYILKRIQDKTGLNSLRG